MKKILLLLLGLGLVCVANGATGPCSATVRAASGVPSVFSSGAIGRDPGSTGGDSKGALFYEEVYTLWKTKKIANPDNINWRLSRYISFEFLDDTKIGITVKKALFAQNSMLADEDKSYSLDIGDLDGLQKTALFAIAMLHLDESTDALRELEGGDISADMTHKAPAVLALALLVHRHPSIDEDGSGRGHTELKPFITDCACQAGAVLDNSTLSVFHKKTCNMYSETYFLGMTGTVY